MTADPEAAAAVAAEAKRLAIPRLAEPDEITRMVLFVASDEASFSTGSEFIVDGGVLLGSAPQRERAETAGHLEIKRNGDIVTVSEFPSRELTAD